MHRKLLLLLVLLLTPVQTFADIIASQAAAKANQWVCFRTQIDVHSRFPARNTLRIAADTKYWLWVNGELEAYEGGLKRGPTPTDSYIDVLSLAHLKTEKNTIAVLVWHFGKEGFAHKNSGTPALSFDLNIDGEHFVSDTSWRAHIHPAYYTPMDDTPNWRLATLTPSGEGQFLQTRVKAGTHHIEAQTYHQP